MTFPVARSWFFVLFTLSGFAGLIYESIWSHYLKLFLGHSAYAQTLVLAIFMGGMAIGSWVCSLYSGRWRSLLLGYAVVEAVIGLCALLFHKAFVGFTDFSYDTVMPGLGSPLAVNAYKWAVSALFILPQSILLGMTFPLMTGGVIRAYPHGTGGTIAMLYFTNSLGAAAGVLASGFFLIEWVGLPGTVLTAGLLNLLLAAMVWLVAKGMTQREAAPPARPVAGARVPVAGYRLMLAISLLTGLASFMYEIGWIRMLSMVLGSSTHAFELMLSAFILGLAFGGLWIKRRIDRTADAEKVLGIVQVAMGLLALATLPVYGQTFELMQALLDTVARSSRGYAAFNFGSHLIALLVMFPAAFCAGMTLPLITHILMRRGAGERAIGAVYAANMVGSIAGVFLAVHLLMPVIGLKGLITAGAAVDVGLGLVLLWWTARRTWWPRAVTAAGIAALGGTLAWVQLDSYKMASGVYRHGVLFTSEGAEILYHRDGKTATINLVRFPGRTSITTNGKPDAAVNLDPDGEVVLDESTMILTGALPIALHPAARSAANIGFGSGLSSHVLLAAGGLERVDTIEIEPAIVEAARGFSPRNDRVFSDRRSEIHIEDAKTFFAAHNKRYDIIVSEPSNPWVSGVAGLFTEEFYRRVKRHLNRDGIFVQWLQLYEINPQLVASVFKALGGQFRYYEVYASNDADIIIIARDGTALPRASDAVFTEPALAHELRRIRIFGPGDLDLHRVGSKAVLQPYFDNFAIGPNSEYFPVLEMRAARARFMRESATSISQLNQLPVPVLELLGDAGRRAVSGTRVRPWLGISEATRGAFVARDYLLTGRRESLDSLSPILRSDFELVRLLVVECALPNRFVTVDSLATVMGAMLPYLTPEELRPVWEGFRRAACHPGLPQAQRQWLELFESIGRRQARQTAQHAEQLLRSPHPGATARVDYLLAAFAAGGLATGEVEKVRRIWQEFAPRAVSAQGNQMPEFLAAHLAKTLRKAGRDTEVSGAYAAGRKQDPRDEREEK